MEATFRFHGELNIFLSKLRRQVAFPYSFAAHQTVKDLIEALGVPHGEVDVVLADGRSLHFSERLGEGAEVDVYAAYEGPAVHHLRPRVEGEPKFLLDVPLGKLARHLRLLGFDAWWRRDFDDKEIAELARREGRWLLTRDRRLLMRKAVTHGAFVRNVLPRLQLTEVMARFQLAPCVRPLTRCMKCNGILRVVDKAEILARLEPKTRLYYEEFSRCEGCGRIYWEGSHYETIQDFLERCQFPFREEKNTSQKGN